MPANTQLANLTRNHTRAKTVDAFTEQGKKNEKAKKKGIFRGLGSMFRYIFLFFVIKFQITSFNPFSSWIIKFHFKLLLEIILSNETYVELC